MTYLGKAKVWVRTRFRIFSAAGEWEKSIAHDAKRGRDVAIKTLPKEFGAHPGACRASTAKHAYLPH